MFDVIRTQMAKSVPFVATVGIEIESIAPGRAVAKLVQREPVSNHIGSMHAGALFTLGETASGAAMSGAFASRLSGVRPVATGASIAYGRIAKGEISARAAISGSAEELVGSLDAAGRVTFDVDVTMSDATGETIATMTVGWLVAKRGSRP